MQTYTYRGVRAAVLFSTMLQLIPAPQVVAQLCPEEAVAPARWPLALPDTYHTHKTASINNPPAHAYDLLQ